MCGGHQRLPNGFDNACICMERHMPFAWSVRPCMHHGSTALQPLPPLWTRSPAHPPTYALPPAPALQATLQRYHSACTYGKLRFAPETNLVVGPVEVPCSGTINGRTYDTVNRWRGHQPVAGRAITACHSMQKQMAFTTACSFMQVAVTTAYVTAHEAAVGAVTL